MVRLGTKGPQSTPALLSVGPGRQTRAHTHQRTRPKPPRYTMGSPLKKSKPHTSIHMWGLRVDPAAPEKQIGEKYLLFRGACTPFR